MAEKFLRSGEYAVLQRDFPELFDGDKRNILVDIIGSYHSKILELLPEEFYPEFSSKAPEMLREHSEYIGRKIAEILNFWKLDIVREKQLWVFFLSEIMRDHYGTRIWRSVDEERVFEYEVNTHGDTVVECVHSDTWARGYLSFGQSVYPLIITVLLYIQSIDPTGENTLGKWEWQKNFFRGYNPWKWRGMEIIPYKEWGESHFFGDALYEDVPDDIWGLHFSLMNGLPCFPVLDKPNKQLSFYVRNPEWGIQIGALGSFKADFILKEADLENMFLVLCQLVARDSYEILYGIMRYFPEYYQGLVGEKNKRTKKRG